MDKTKEKVFEILDIFYEQDTVMNFCFECYFKNSTSF